MEKPGTQLESFYAPRLLERRFKWQRRKIRKVCCILEKLSADCASWGTAWWCSLLGLQVCSVLASWLWRSGPIIGTSSMTIQPTTQVRATWAHILDCGGLLKVRQLNSNPLLRSVVCARCQSQGLQMKCGWAVRRFRDALSVKLLCVKKKKKKALKVGIVNCYLCHSEAVLFLTQVFTCDLMIRNQMVCDVAAKLALIHSSPPAPLREKNSGADASRIGSPAFVQKRWHASAAKNCFSSFIILHQTRCITSPPPLSSHVATPPSHLDQPPAGSSCRWTDRRLQRMR